MDLNTLRQMNFVLTFGAKAVERWVEKTDIKNIIYANNVEVAFKMIQLGRADLFVGTEVYTSIISGNPEFSDIKVISQPLFSVPLYMVLSKKNIDLEPAITAAIKELAESGRTSKIFGIHDESPTN